MFRSDSYFALMMMKTTYDPSMCMRTFQILLQLTEVLSRTDLLHKRKAAPLNKMRFGGVRTETMYVSDSSPTGDLCCIPVSAVCDEGTSCHTFPLICCRDLLMNDEHRRGYVSVVCARGAGMLPREDYLCRF